MLITIRVIPKSSINRLEQLSEFCFKAKITSTPEKGKANEKIIELLAKHFKTTQSNITIKSGATRKTKTIEIIS
jgi:uncharacterized protein (TIGR00251 family)